MKHTIKLLTLAFMLATILTLTGCPGPVNNYIEPPVWDDGVVTTEPTCIEEGVKTYTCSNGETRTETIPALGHDFGEWEITKNPTCTEKGSKTRKCSRCGETETAEIDALGHNWVLESDTATCTTVGVKTYKCSRCNETRTEDSPAHHTFIAGGCDKCGTYQYADGIKFHLYVTTQEKYNEIYPTNNTNTVRLYSSTRSYDIWDDYYLSFENENSLPNGVFYYDVEEEGERVNMIRLLGLKNLNHNSFKYGVAENTIVNNSTFHIGISLTFENNFYIVLN